MMLLEVSKVSRLVSCYALVLGSGLVFMVADHGGRRVGYKGKAGHVRLAALQVEGCD